MSGRPVVAIVNPRAGLTARAALEAVRCARGRFAGVTPWLTERRGHARELARQAVSDGAEILIACGGDGTINEVAGGMLGGATTLAILPAGSGNGLGRTLGIPCHPGRALEILGSAVPRRMDVGMINGGVFLNVAGAGFDAAVGHAFDLHCRSGGRRGVWTYFRVGLKTAWSYGSEVLTLDCGAGGASRRRLLVTFANGRQYGGGAQIAPRARLDDGALDVVSITEASVSELILNAPRMYLGSIEGFKRYERTLAPTAVLTGPNPIPFHRDGEPEPPSERLEVRVEPRALRVLVPEAVAGDPDGPFVQHEAAED